VKHQGRRGFAKLSRISRGNDHKQVLRYNPAEYRERRVNQLAEAAATFLPSSKFERQKRPSAYPFVIRTLAHALAHNISCAAAAHFVNTSRPLSATRAQLVEINAARPTPWKCTYVFRSRREKPNILITFAICAPEQLCIPERGKINSGSTAVTCNCFIYWFIPFSLKTKSWWIIQDWD
jgi:hypothetical protein